jgi:hypothetical protein
MQAMNGSAVSFRSRARLLGCAIALVALAATMFAPSAGAAVKPPVTDYLAFGDSLAFGYTAVKYAENKPNEAPAFFDEGYVNFYGKKVRMNKAKPENKGLVIVNDACPGESGDSFMNTGATNKFGTKTCEYQEAFRVLGPGFGGPLHHPYPGKSQISNLTSLLNGGAPAHPITAISLNIGANDELAAVAKCKAEVKAEFEAYKKYAEEYAKEKAEVEKGEKAEIEKAPPPEHPSKYELGKGGVKESVLTCVGGGAKATFEKIITRIAEIVGTINGPGKYKGKIVLLGFYNPQAMFLPQSDGLQESLNQAVEDTFTHKEKCENPEENPETCKKVPNPFFVENVIYANPMPKINPFPHALKGEKAAIKEETAICKYTEECNPTAVALNEAATKKSNEKEEAGCYGTIKTEAECEEVKKEEKAGEPKKTVIFPFNGEGDIHPTKAGYELMAKVMFGVAPL